MTAIILHDPDAYATLVAGEFEARLLGACSRCEEPTDRDELDASSRCRECAP